MTSIYSYSNTADILKTCETFRNAPKTTIRNTNKTLSKRYEELLRSEKYCDCIFNIEGSTVKGHKLLLSAASPVFEAMLYGPLQEQNDVIDILDVSSDIFKKLLEYIYMGNVDFDELSLEDLFELYYCGEKYLLKELIADCLQTITPKLCFSNILQALELAISMDFDTLIDVCMVFFSNYCLKNAMFLNYHKRNYYHTSRKCIKAIITANKCTPDQVLWFVYEWCQRECNDMDIKNDECLSIIHDLKLDEADGECCDIFSLKSVLQQQQTIFSAKRLYYKASRPFQVDQISNEWKFSLRCDRYIILYGLIIHGRLTPSTLITAKTQHYNENIDIEVSAPVDQPSIDSETNPNALLNNFDQEMTVIWQFKLQDHQAKYNLDSCINWQNGLTLSPNVPYQIKISWPTQAYGAEYSCCIQSNSINGIYFYDLYQFCGSLVKGIYFKEFIQ